MNTTNEYLDQSQLALAAYADFSGAASTFLQALQNADMSSAQAADFLGDWQVAAQYTDPTTGVSATVFQDTAGKKYLAIRGTEPSATDITADGLLALGIPSSLNPQFNALKAQIDLWMNDPNVLQGQTFTVSGHSLGGYLAAAVKQTYAQVTDAYLYNAPGVGGPLGNLADALTSAFGLSGAQAGNIWNIRSSEGFPIISGLGYQLGTAISIQTEAASGAGLANHSIVRMTDALAIQSLYAQLAPGLKQEQLNALVDTSGATMSLTFESALDALRTILLGSGITQTATDVRDDFYANLYNLTSDPRYTALAGTAQLMVLANLPSAAIAAMAGNNNAQGLAARYALVALNPFALVGADYSAFNAGGELNLYDPNTRTGALTEQYLTDRAAFLERKLWFSTQDKNPVDPNVVFDPNNHLFQNESTYFEDAASGYKIAQGFAPDTPYANIHRYYFGDTGNNTFAGGDVEDHLYGGAGNDTLQGNGGNDYLEGGAADDTLDGGAGYDTYTLEGRDTIRDSDGNGIIKDKAGNIVSGAIQKNADGTCTYLNDPSVGVTLDANLTLTLTLADGTTAIIENYQSGNLGLRLSDTATQPAGLTLTGDLAPIVYGTDTNGNPIYHYDPSNNVITDPGTPEAGRADWLYGNTGNDLITGKGGSDILYGSSGDDRLYADTQIDVASAIALGNSQTGSGLKGDWLSGGAGDDTLVAGDGNDVLFGGSGADLLAGGAGDDDILGDKNYLPDSFDWTVTTQADGTRLFSSSYDLNGTGVGGADTIYAGAGADYVWAGAGNDIVYGEAGADRLVGEAGNDILMGGAGDDILWGGADNDYLDGGAGIDEIQGGVGDDILMGGADNDTLWGGTGDDTLIGGLGDDRLYGESGANYLDGGDGNDILNSGGPGSELYGGAGNDGLSAAGGGSYLDGEDGTDTLTADGGNNELFGGAGKDTLQAGGGNNYLDGEEGNDTLLATGGNNTLYGGAGDDTLRASGGGNTLDGGDGRDLYVFDAGFGVNHISDSGAGGNILQFNFGFAGSGIAVGLGSLKLSFAPSTGSGQVRDELHIDNFDPNDPANTCSIDTFQFNDRTLTLQEILDIGGPAVQPASGPDITGTNNADTIQGTNLRETIRGLAGNDTINAGAGNDIIEGGDGNDTLDGGTGADAIKGGTGNDTYVVDNTADTVTENLNEGWDTVQSSVDYTLGAHVEDLFLTGPSSFDASGGSGQAPDNINGTGNDIVQATETEMAKTTNGAICAVLHGCAKSEAANDPMPLAA